MDQRATDAAQSATSVAFKVGYSVSGGTVFMGLAWSEIGVIVGIAGTVIMTATSIYYRHKEYRLKLARAKHDGVDTEVLDDDE